MANPSTDIIDFQEIALSDNQLSYYDLVPRSNVHGPGNRFCLWLQGCRKRCAGCINPHMLELEVKRTIRLEAILDLIRQSRDGVTNVEGVTLMGGEPMLQATEISKMIQILKSEKDDFNILIFTGYLLEELQSLNNPGVNSLLAQTDTIVDGEFDHYAIDSRLVRGSTNQNIHHLTPVLAKRDFSRRKQEETLAFSGGQIISGLTGIKI